MKVLGAVSLALLLVSVVQCEAGARPKVLCYGDSITAGYLDPSYPVALAALRPDLAVTNGGLGADVSTNIARLDALLAANDYSVVVLLIGTNDYWLGLTPKQTYQNIWTMAQHAKADGAEVVILTLTPVACPIGSTTCDLGVAFAREAFTNDVAHWLIWRDLDNAHPHVTIADIRSAFLVLGWLPFTSDGLHLSAVGDDFVARFVSAQIP